MAEDKEDVKDDADEKDGKGKKDKKDKKGKKDKKDKSDKKDKKEKKGGDGEGGSFLAWVLIALIVVVVSAGGGVAANIFMGAPPPAAAEAEEGDDAAAEKNDEEADITASDDSTSQLGKEYAYFEFEPMNVNLNVKKLNKWLNVGIVLALPKDKEKELTAFLDPKKDEMRNWMRAYLTELTPDKVGGRANMGRIQREIADGLNAELWPKTNPKIHHVLFKVFIIQ